MLRVYGVCCTYVSVSVSVYASMSACVVHVVYVVCDVCLLCV